MWHHPLSIWVTLLMPCKTGVAVTSQGTRSSSEDKSKQNHLRFLLQIFAYRLSHGHMNVDHTLVSCPISRGCWYAVLTLKDFPFPFLGLTILRIISGHRSPQRSSWTLSTSLRLRYLETCGVVVSVNDLKRPIHHLRYLNSLRIRFDLSPSAPANIGGCSQCFGKVGFSLKKSASTRSMILVFSTILLLRAPCAVLIPEAITDKSELCDKMIEAAAGKILSGGRTMSAAGVYLLLGVYQSSGRGSR